MKTLTVFTPTYNRAHLLPRLYDSLCKQTSKDFEWLVIDDGSVDHTADLIRTYIGEGKIPIHYIYKENGGMSSAHNAAFENTATELVVCLDSDDILTDDAVELITNTWRQRNKNVPFAGVIADCVNMSTKEVLGKKMPDDLDTVKFYDVYYRYKLSGDKVLVYLSDVIKKNPYRLFEGEKLTPLDMKYLEISDDLLVLHVPCMEKEYQDGGITKNIPVVYVKNPNGMAYYHQYRMKRVKNLKVKVKSIIHYIACSKLVGTKRVVMSSPYPLATWMLYPLGLLWYYKLRSIKKKIEKKDFPEL
jgi:glycosyltransferase involved in cell wall biosynthesis